MDLAELMRYENEEQFNTLVRMHLSFELDLNTDEWVQSTRYNKVQQFILIHVQLAATKSPKNWKRENGLIFTKNRKTVAHQLSQIVRHVVR